MLYEVIVVSVGRVHEGEDRALADAAYAEAVCDAECPDGVVTGETVLLMADGKTVHYREREEASRGA